MIYNFAQNYHNCDILCLLSLGSKVSSKSYAQMFPWFHWEHSPLWLVYLADCRRLNWGTIFDHGSRRNDTSTSYICLVRSQTWRRKPWERARWPFLGHRSTVMIMRSSRHSNIFHSIQRQGGFFSPGLLTGVLARANTISPTRAHAIRYRFVLVCPPVFEVVFCSVVFLLLRQGTRCDESKTESSFPMSGANFPLVSFTLR